MGGAAAVVGEIVARPDAAIRLVNRQLVRAELAPEQPPFPRQMPLNHRPHAPRVFEIARPQQMPEKGIHADEVHVVVRLREVAVGVERGFVARKICGLLGRRNFAGHRAGVLLFRKALEMFCRAIMPAEFIAGITDPPAEQPHPPRHAAMQVGVHAIIPDRIRRDIQRGSSRIDEWIGSLHHHAPGECGATLLFV